MMAKLGCSPLLGSTSISGTARFVRASAWTSPHWGEESPEIRTYFAEITSMRAFIRHMRTTKSAYADDFERWLSAAEARRA